MESLKHLNLAMNYIEANLEGEIDFQKVAQIACCSEYHFRRMFSFLSGMTLNEYIGYDSPDSFSRAFQVLHGVTPKEAFHHADLSAQR